MAKKGRDESSVNLAYIDKLPSVESTTYYGVFTDQITHASARVMLGEVLEQERRYRDALAFAQAELQVGVALDAIVG